MVRFHTVPSARSFLRKATKRSHSQIDQTSVLAFLTSPGVPLDPQSCGLCPADVPAYIARGPSLNHYLVALDLSPDDVRRAKPRSGLKAHHPGGNGKAQP